MAEKRKLLIVLAYFAPTTERVQLRPLWRRFPEEQGCRFAGMAIFGHTSEKTRPLTRYRGARLLMRFRSTRQSSAWRGSSTDGPADNPSNSVSCLG